MKIEIDEKEYDLLEKNNILFFKYDDFINLVKPDFVNHILDKIENFENDNIFNENNRINYNNFVYYDINLVIIILNDFNLANKIILALKNKNALKYIWHYVFDNFSTVEINDEYDYLYKFVDYFNSINKLESKETDSNNLYGFSYKDANYYLNLLSKIKNKVNNKIIDDEDEEDDKDKFYYFESDDKILSDDFGKLRDDITFDLLIYDSYLDYDKKITSALNAANIFYMIVKEKPFIAYNLQIAAIIALDTLQQTDGLKKKYAYGYYEDLNGLNVTSSDLIYAYKLIMENSKKSRIKVIELIEPLFGDKSLDLGGAENEKKLNKVKNDPSIENIYKFIINFTKHYIGYQGYYDYYKSNEEYVYKIHYHARYVNFELNLTKTIEKRNTLVFDCDAHAYTEAPNDLKARDKVIIALYDEIKQRSYNDILKNYLSLLKNNLKEYYNDSIKVEFNMKWDYEINPDYEW